MSASSEPVALEYELTESEFASFHGEAFARSRLYKWLWPQRRFLLGRGNGAPQRNNSRHCERSEAIQWLIQAGLLRR
jgi:hypothetical protein